MTADHYPDLAEDELWDKRERLLFDLKVYQKHYEKHGGYVAERRRIRIELIHLADALDACVYRDGSTP